jgi:hypothetical protein
MVLFVQQLVREVPILLELLIGAAHFSITKTNSNDTMYNNNLNGNEFNGQNETIPL